MKLILVAAVAALSAAVASAVVLTGLEVPDSLHPRAGEWGGMKTVFVPLPKGGEMFVVNEGGDQTKGLQKEFQIVAKMPCISGLKSLIPAANRIEIPLFGQTFFGVKHDDIEPQMVLYEGGVVVKGMYTVLIIGIPKGYALDSSVLNILSQFSLRLPADNFVDKILALVAQQEQPAMRIAGLRFAMNMSPESAELVQALLKASREGGNTAVEEWCKSALVELNPAVYGNEKRLDAPNCTAVVDWLALKPGLQVASVLRLPKVEGVPDQVAENAPKQTLPIPEGAGFAPVNLPRFKLPTLEEADAALRKIHRPNRRRFTPNRTRAKTVKPILADDIVNATTRKAAIAQLREGLQSLLGPFSEAGQKRFDEKWNAVSEYPCEAILEWLKKACPIVTSMLMLKSEMGALATDYDHAMHEADITRNLRNYEACDEWMEEVGRLASEMKGVQASLEEEANKLAGLGEMPDPVEEKTAARKRHRAARETALELFGGTPSDDTRKDIDGEYVTDEGFLLFESGDKYYDLYENSGFGLLSKKTIYIHPIAEFEEDGEKAVGLLVVGNSEPKKYLGGRPTVDKDWKIEDSTEAKLVFAMPEKGGGYYVYQQRPYDTKQTMLYERTTITHDADDKGKPVLRITYTYFRSDDGHMLTSTALFRHTGREIKRLPRAQRRPYLGKDAVADEKLEETYRNELEKTFKTKFPEALAARKTFEKIAETTELKELPASCELRYVLDRIDFPNGKKFRVEKPNSNDLHGRDWLDMKPYKDEHKAYWESLSYEERNKVKFKFIVLLSRLGENLLSETTLDTLGYIQREQFDIGHFNGNRSTFVRKDAAERIERVRWHLPPKIVRIDRLKSSPITMPVWVEFETMAKHKNPHYDEVQEHLTGRWRFRVSPHVENLRTPKKPYEYELFLKSGRKYECCTNEARQVRLTLPLTSSGRIHHDVAVRLDFPDAAGEKIDKDDFIRPAVRFHYKLETLKGRHLAEREKEVEAKFAQGGGDEKKEPETEEEAEVEAKQERIAFHKENIRFLQRTISGLKKELEGEKDPGRRSSLEYAIMLEESNIVYENDRIRAEQTGEFTASRTPFDDFCKVQFLQNIQKEIQEIQTLERAKKRVSFLVDKMPPGERETALALESKLDTESAEDLAQWRKLGDAMEKKYMGRLTYEQGMAESEVADREEALRRVEVLKKGCDYLMIMGGGELPQAISTIYSLSTSVLEESSLEDGLWAGLKTAVTSWSKTIDYVWTAYEGYDSGGLVGMAQAVGMNYVMGDIVPSLVEKAKGVEIKLPWKKPPKAKTGAAMNKNIFADLNAMEFEMGKAKQEVDAFVDAYQKYESAKASGASKEQLAKMEAALVKPIAQINENPTAKALMKYTEVGGKGPEFSKAMQAGFDSRLQDIHSKVIERFNALQHEKGYNRQQIVPIRNETSKGTVGMDADFGLVEQPSIRVLDDGTLAPNMWMRQNYERTTKQKWMVDAQASWNKAYAEVTGGYSARKSWENITTSGHPEAYRDMSILKADPKKGNMAEIMEGISLSNAQQIMDVTRFKSDEMLSMKDFPRLVGLRESCRGTAKDMNTKLLPALDARIKPLKELEAKLTKSGQALWPDSARELQRLTAARDHYKKVCDSFDKIGKGKIPPKDWDDEVYTTTGGMGINDCLNDMSDLFRSLFFAK